MEDKTYIVVHNENSYNVGHFLKLHPGGCNYVQAYRGTKVRNKMLETDHSQSAMYLLREYKLGGRDAALTDGQEDLESLVDWNKPILAQVGDLGPKYNEWSTAPVDRRLRLFKNSFLEVLTITPWYIVPMFWIPIILCFLYSGINHFAADIQHLTGIAYIQILSSFILGLIIWSFLEYTIHRWVFHRVPNGTSKLFIYFHFLMHGLHHKVPYDSKRLVFPPFPAAIIVTVGYFVYKRIFPDYIVHIIGAGTLFGYLCYDLIHFYLHYGSPKENTYLYIMKRYHNHHHFSHSDNGFGVSTYFWDKVFGTAIILRKLAMAIKW